MPKLKRHPTRYPGVTYVNGIDPRNGKPERIYYIRYRRDGVQKEEKAGRQHIDDMTPAKAARIRAERMSGAPTNEERREAERRAKEAEAGRWTFDRLWAEYERHNPDLKGIKTDRNRYHNHIAPVFGNKEPQQLSPLDVDRFRLQLQKKKKMPPGAVKKLAPGADDKLSPGTVRNIMELLRRLINFGTRLNLCEGTNAKIHLPRVNNLRTEDLSPSQLSSLLEAIEQEPNKQVAHLMLMALYTGMRRGELFRLRWEDIDHERGFILIREPKGGLDQRIPLSDITRGLLEKHPRIEGSPYVFPGRSGSQRVDCIKQVNMIKERAGLPKGFRGMHGLRHVFATMLASSGKVDLYTLQKLLTHKSPAMTQRYAHHRDEALKKAVNRVGSIMDDALTEAGNSKKKGAAGGNVVSLDASRQNEAD